MAKNLNRLNKGQAPSLLDAEKGNEVIDAINHIRASKSTANANASGFILKSNSEGALELDVTQSTANAIEEARQQVVNPYRSVNLTTIENGDYKTYSFVIH